MPNGYQQYTTALALEHDADIYLFTGPIRRNHQSEVINNIKQREGSRGALSENLLLFVQTYGGDPDTAYRIARQFQRRYSKVTTFVPGPCMSAGTLLAIGSNEIVMSNAGTLGPLDMQIAKVEDFLETTSGLTTEETLVALRTEAWAHFEYFLVKLKIDNGFSLRMAADIANTLTTGLFEGIYRQMDPLRIGENSRSVKVAIEYANRLAAKAANCLPGAIKKLTHDYPSHSFNIDYDEARLLFKNLREPTDLENELLEFLIQPGQETIHGYVESDFIEDENEDKEPGQQIPEAPTDLQR